VKPFWLTAFLDLAPGEHEAGTAFWHAVTGYEPSPARGGDGEFTTLVPGTGDDFLRVQRRGEGPSRIHLDLHVADPAAAADEAEALGATVVARPDHVVLASPGGLPFCLVRSGARVRPLPASWPGGFASIVDQVCLDIPATAFEAESSFWQAVTGRELRHSASRSEFANLLRPEDQPLRILLQRLDDGDGPVRAHLDLATTDRAAETARQVALGATVVEVFEHWTVMAGPSGVVHCITDRRPETAMLP
jgi:glyoxalase superfamily protein